MEDRLHGIDLYNHEVTEVRVSSGGRKKGARVKFAGEGGIQARISELNGLGVHAKTFHTKRTRVLVIPDMAEDPGKVYPNEIVVKYTEFKDYLEEHPKADKGKIARFNTETKRDEEDEEDVDAFNFDEFQSAVENVSNEMPAEDTGEKNIFEKWGDDLKGKFV